MPSVVKWMRLFAVTALVAGAATVAGLLLARTPANARSSRSAEPQVLTAAIDAQALSVAAQMGDATPILIQSALGSRVSANRVAGGDIVPGSNTSALVAMRGAFVDDAASVPPGASAPSGTVITLVIDTATGAVTDFGLSDSYPQLGSLGTIFTNSSSAAESARMRATYRREIEALRSR